MRKKAVKLKELPKSRIEQEVYDLVERAIDILGEASPDISFREDELLYGLISVLAKYETRHYPQGPYARIHSKENDIRELVKLIETSWQTEMKINKLHRKHKLLEEPNNG